jgi:hypothetical protein
MDVYGALAGDPKSIIYSTLQVLPCAHLAGDPKGKDRIHTREGGI